MTTLAIGADKQALSRSLGLAPAVELPLPDSRYTSVATVMSRNSKLNQKARFGKTHNVRARSWATRGVMLVLVLVIAGIGMLQTAQPARANIFSDALEGLFCGPEAYFNTPSPYLGSGAVGLGVPMNAALSSVLKGDPKFLKTQHTAYEKYATGGTNFTVYRGGKELTKTNNNRSSSHYGLSKDKDPRIANAECAPVMPIAGSTIANLIFHITKTITTLTAWVYSMTYDPTWVKSLNGTISTLITGNGDFKGLRDALYFPFLNIVLWLGAIYVGWVGLVKKSSIAAAQAALWMVGASLAGALLMFNPKLIPNATQSLTTEVNRAFINATGGILKGKDDGKNICYVPVKGASATGDVKRSQAENWKKSKQARTSEQTVRMMECNMWQMFVFVPWASGQFGVGYSELGNLTKSASGSSVDDPSYEVNLGNNTIIKNVALYQLEQQTMDPFAQSQNGAEQERNKQTRWYQMADDIMIDHQGSIAKSWAGTSSPMDRVGIATLSLVSAGAGLATVLVMSFTVLIYQVGLSMLVFASVLFLLVGAHPGFGRGIALRWAELVVGTVLKIIFASALMNFVLAALAVTIMMNAGYGVSILSVIAISVAAMMYRKPLTEAFSNIHFNGSTSSGIEGGAKGGIERVGAGAMGLALGTVGALTGVGKVASAAGGSAKGVRAAVGSVAKGAGRGGMTGLISGRSTGASAMMAARAGSKAAEATAGKYRAKSAEKLRADEQESQQSNPAVHAERLRKKEREKERRVKQYERDYKQFGGDAAWRDDFQKFYGFAAPNPDEYMFPGYGVKPDHKTAAGRRAWADQKPVPRPVDEDEKQTETGTSKPATETPRPASSPASSPSEAPRPHSRTPHERNRDRDRSRTQFDTTPGGPTLPDVGAKSNEGQSRPRSTTRGDNERSRPEPPKPRPNAPKRPQRPE